MAWARLDVQKSSITIALLWGLPPVVVILAGLYHGTQFIDDAYITFRYAENLALGHGLVFNQGEDVLGTTTPLFAFILAALKSTGISVLLSARWLGLFSMAGVTMILQSLASRSTNLPVAFAMAICVALHPDTAFMANSGMETATSVLLVLASMLLSLRRKPFLAGSVGGAALLIRPDGVLVVALIAGLQAFRDPRKLWRLLLAATIVVTPWLLYATFIYGSPLPHSIQAKQLVHAATISHILLSLVRSLILNLPLAFFFGFGAIGAVLAFLRRSELSLFALWMATYAASLCASGIAPQFPWYVTPLSPVLVLLTVYGVDQIANWQKQRRNKKADAQQLLRQGVVPGLFLLVAALCITDVNWRGFRTDTEGREEAYQKIGNWLLSRSVPADVVFVGEVGVLSYILLDQKIIDSSGINSPEVLRFRKEELDVLRSSTNMPSPEGTWRWVTRVIQDVRPRYIVTKYPWLHIGAVEDLPWFQERYMRVMLDYPELSEYRVYEKRSDR